MAERVLQDYFATWCTPCKALVPILQELEENELSNKVRVERFNVEDDNWNSADSLGIKGVPTLIALEDDQEVLRIVGFRSKEKLLQALRAAFPNAGI